MTSSLTINNVVKAYGDKVVLNNLSFKAAPGEFIVLVGPSGCGKSTMLRSVAGLESVSSGTIEIDGRDVTGLQPKDRDIAMVFQDYALYPHKTVYENIAFGVRLYEKLSKSEMDGRVEQALRGGALWDEVKDKLNASGLSLSGGQQQRLCIARTVAVKPEVILFDEPCSALDPISTAKIEELIDELKKDYTIVIVTHNMQQAARVSDFTAFMYLGELVEFGATATLFTTPSDKRTQAYITGRFG